MFLKLRYSSGKIVFISSHEITLTIGNSCDSPRGDRCRILVLTKGGKVAIQTHESWSWAEVEDEIEHMMLCRDIVDLTLFEYENPNGVEEEIPF